MSKKQPPLSQRIRVHFETAIEGLTCPTCGHARSIADIAAEIGISPVTLGKFRSGESVSVSTLDAVEGWLLLQSESKARD